jgi:hypothetical protein
MQIIKMMVKLITFTSGLLLTLRVVANNLKKTWGQMYKEFSLGTYCSNANVNPLNM